jgi:Domain of unknown function (DUF1998)
MARRRTAKRSSRPKILGDLRPSQVVGTFGPGAVVDLPTASLIIAGTDFWNPEQGRLIDEPRLRSMLRVSAFFRPAVKADPGSIGVPAFPFPRYLVCPRCDRLAPYMNFAFDGHSFRCGQSHRGAVPRGGPLAFPARFVVACAAGHLDDFPWYSYVHEGTGATCPHDLQFWGSGSSGSVGDLHVRCQRCGEDRSLKYAFGPGASKVLGPCAGRRPWLGDGYDEQCDKPLRTLLRGSSNLYFPIVQSALSIPEWDDPIQAAIARHEEALEKVKTEDEIEILLRVGNFPGLEAVEPAVILQALELRRQQAEHPPTPMDIRYEEFRALRSQPKSVDEHKREFEIEPAETPPGFEDLIERVVVVRRLKEVRALDGFSRIDSAFDIALDDEQPETFQRQSLSGEQLHWRPAVELRGEGVFLELREEEVAKWEARTGVKELAATLEHAHVSWRHERDLVPVAFPGSRYVLLHSLAHLLINGLSLDCGYSSTSIRERIYSSTGENTRMAGILLYTATPDSDGSLGGLADQGRPERLGTLLRDCLERAQYCSSDPLCGHEAAAEMGLLNGAACHACLLVAETSCERANRYLDRAHVVETVAQLGASYFTV